VEIYLTHIADYLLAQSWQIAVLTIAVAIAAFALKNRSAHIRYLLWLVVVAKCLTPPLLTIPLAILPQEKPAIVLEAVGTTVSEPLELPLAPPETALATVVREEPKKLNIREWLGIAWLVGAGIYLMINLLRALRANLWLARKRRALSAELRSDIESLFSAHRIRSFPGVWLMDGISQPFVWGLLRGSIYLPANFLNVKNPDHQRSVLGHELSHIVRFDAAVNFLQVIAQAIFWFHPFVWWANKKIRTEREKCCDEMAIARLNALPKDYSTAILETLAAKHEQTRPVPSLAVAGPVKNIEERIKTMLRPGKKFYKHPSFRVIIILLLVALLTVPIGCALKSRSRTETATEFEDKPTKSLRQAAKDGDLERLKKLIAEGADVNATDEKGWTPLHLASYRGHADVVKLLIDHDASVNVQNEEGRTPLHYAGRRDHRGIAELLLAKGANVNAKDINGDTPLHITVEAGYKRVAELLIDEGADINAKSKSGWTPLHRAVGNHDLVKLLISKGADVNAKLWGFETPLYLAARFGHKDVAEFLIAKGANVSALHLAAYRGDLVNIKHTVDQGDYVDAQDEGGRTLLHWAVWAEQKNVAEFLIAKRADVNSKDANGDTPLTHAAWTGNQDIVELLISKGADIDPDSWGGGPLHRAVWSGHRNIVELLIAKGANVNGKDGGGCTPLCYTRFVDKDVTEILIARGANVNLKDNSGRAPLHWICWRGREDLAKLLIAKEADISAKDKDGHTPLWYAKENGHTKIVELLRKYGARD